jgi:NAD(P)-dependent dehydrogenase (short-subunit alcohol dehydrogenase family)
MRFPAIPGASLVGLGRPQRDEFAGKVAVITGGGSGIGRSTAILLSQLGATVHVADIVPDNAEAVAAEIVTAGGKAIAHQTDVADAQAVETLAEDVYAASGRVDILFNNAGVGVLGPVEEFSLDDWQRIININLMGVVHGVFVFMPRMLAQGGGGHIVNTASMLGLYTWPQFAPYVTSKYAVVGLTEALAMELGPKGIYVSAICPGMISTSIHKTTSLSGQFADRHDELGKWLNRLGSSPDSVARAVVDAIVRRQLIRPVPWVQVQPAWMLHRISPKASGTVGRLIFGLVKPK